MSEPETKLADKPPAGAPNLQYAAQLVAGARAAAEAAEAAEERWREWSQLCWACDHGYSATVARYIPDLPAADAGWALQYRRTLHKACVAGRLPIVALLVGRFGLTAADVLLPDTFASVCAAGRQEMAEWLADKFELTAVIVRENDNVALHRACRGGHLGVAAWLADHFGLTSADAGAHDNRALRWACDRDQLDAAQWLVARFGLTAADAQVVLRRTRANATATWLAGQFPQA